MQPQQPLEAPITSNVDTNKTNVFVHHWKIDGEEVTDESLEILPWRENMNSSFVECLASNALGTSYAFLNLASDNTTER